jgi:hypothetical protein
MRAVASVAAPGIWTGSVLPGWAAERAPAGSSEQRTTRLLARSFNPLGDKCYTRPSSRVAAVDDDDAFAGGGGMRAVASVAAPGIWSSCTPCYRSLDCWMSVARTSRYRADRISSAWLGSGTGTGRLERAADDSPLGPLIQPEEAA